MGLFFFISGFLATKSIKKYRSKDFIIGKSKRLLLPVFFLCFLAIPLYFYIAYCNKYQNINFGKFYISEYIGKGHLSYEHGWFLVVLFLFLAAYMLINKLILEKIKIKLISIKLNPATLIVTALIMAVISFIVRKYYPVNEWKTILGIIGIEPAHIPQYIIMFILGIVAYKNQWLNNLNKKIGISSICIGIVFIVLFCIKNYLGETFDDLIINDWAFFESFICVFLSMGILYIFKQFFNKETNLSKMLYSSYFGAYLIHNDFVVLFQVLISEVNINVYCKYTLVSICSIILSFLVSYLFIYFYNSVRYRNLKKKVVY